MPKKKGKGEVSENTQTVSKEMRLKETLPSERQTDSENNDHWSVSTHMHTHVVKIWTLESVHVNIQA